MNCRPSLKFFTVSNRVFFFLRLRADACLYYLDDLEAEVAFVQHDDLVLVCAVVDHVPQGEQCFAAGQHRLTPGGVALVANHQAAAVVCDGFVQDGRLLCLL